MISITLLDNKKVGHDDLLFEIPKLEVSKTFDSYYFYLAVETEDLTVKYAIATLIESWKTQLKKAQNGQIIYLPIGFYDQGIECIKVEKNEDLQLSFGYSNVGGYAKNPLEPDHSFYFETDFKLSSTKKMQVKIADFENCLTHLITSLK